MAKITYESVAGSYIQPAWAADPIDDRNIIPGGAQLDPDKFPFSDGFKVSVSSAVVAGNGVSIPVTVLTGDIPAGYTLNFGGNKYAVLTQKATKGDAVITANVSAPLSGNEIANYAGVSGKKLVKAGTLVGRTYAERDSGISFSPYAAGDEEVYLLAFDTQDAQKNPDCELLRHHTLVRDHLLPGWTELSQEAKSAIRLHYYTQRAPFAV